MRERCRCSGIAAGGRGRRIGATQGAPPCRVDGVAPLNVHFHVLGLDGVFAAGAGGTLRFHPVRARRVPNDTRAVVSNLQAVVVCGPERRLTMRDRGVVSEQLVAVVVAITFGCLARPAGANVDASGRWYTELRPFGISCQLDFTQQGAALDVDSSQCFFLPSQLTGTIDSVTGAFALGGPGSPICFTATTIEAMIAPDGASWSGAFTCPTVFPDVSLVARRCGNGVVDPSEECDDGNPFGFDCCSPTCTLIPAGAPCGFGPCQGPTCDGSGICPARSGPCDDFNSCTGGDMCEGGFCVGETLPNGTSCEDFSICTTNDTCQFGFCQGGEPVDCGACQSCDFFSGCVPQRSFACQPSVSGRSTLELRDDPRDRKDVVNWKLTPGAPVSILDFGDPRSDTSFDLCVFEDFGFGRLLAGLEVPPDGTCNGKPCWTARRDGYRYSDRSGAIDGVRRVTLEAGEARRAELAVKAKGENLALSSLPALLPVVVQLQGSNGSCWEAEFFDASLNGPLEFRAQTSEPPLGAFVGD